MVVVMHSPSAHLVHEAGKPAAEYITKMVATHRASLVSRKAENEPSAPNEPTFASECVLYSKKTRDLQRKINK